MISNGDRQAGGRKGSVREVAAGCKGKGRRQGRNDIIRVNNKQRGKLHSQRRLS